METISNGLMLVFNGFLTVLTSVVDWRVLAGLAMAASLVWLARLEIDNVDEQGTKPFLPRG